RLVTMCQGFPPMRDADRHRLAADRTTHAVRQRLLRGETHPTFAVPVEMIFSLLGKEFDGADVALAALERAPHGKVINVAVEQGGFAAKLAGRMGIGIRSQAGAVEGRYPPIHTR